MENQSEDINGDARRERPRADADNLLLALDIDSDAYELKTAAAFRALAEEVLFLRGEEARLRRSLAATEKLADRDALCPVFNRRAFIRELTREMALATRHKTPLCLVYVDLDRFKLVNDRFGHARGDETLKRVCDIVQAQVRQTDIVGRLGGDEFAIILGHSELADSQLKANRLNDRIDRMRVCATSDDNKDEPIRLGASCGVVQWDGKSSAETLIAAADEAMFRAKATRKPGSV